MVGALIHNQLSAESGARLMNDGKILSLTNHFSCALALESQWGDMQVRRHNSGQSCYVHGLKKGLLKG